MDLLPKLKAIDDFMEVPEEQMQWLIDRSDCLSFAKGEYLFSPGKPIDTLYIILEGDFLLKAERNNQFQILGKFPAKTITGFLPYSRAAEAKGYAEALNESHVLTLHGDHFLEMIKNCHELTSVFVHTMSTRIRQFTKREQQDDKMISLGKLSAGLAHELNNPSAAVVRSSQELSRHLRYLPDKFKSVIKIRMTDEDVDEVNRILFDKLAKGIRNWSLMEKSEKEDELMDWLDDEQIKDSDEIATHFTEYDIDLDDLEDIKQRTGTEHLGAVIGWLNQVITTEKLVAEIEDASQRINDLVGSIKSYTHMDQAPDKVPTDIHVGILNTLTMLNHKIKSKKVEVIKNFEHDLPLTSVLPSPINQVWTNLIDNAIDAMENADKKQLTIETKKDGDFVNVSITDSGSGISEEIKDKIFDPFFTTKAIGKGTGLGLEFVQEIVRTQHSGSLYLDSKPGKTTFMVCLPIEAEF